MLLQKGGSANLQKCGYFKNRSQGFANQNCNHSAGCTHITAFAFYFLTVALRSPLFSAVDCFSFPIIFDLFLRRHSADGPRPILYLRRCEIVGRFASFLPCGRQISRRLGKRSSKWKQQQNYIRHRHRTRRIKPERRTAVTTQSGESSCQRNEGCHSR